MVASEVIFELGLILGIATLLALVGKLIKQPSIIAYLITGIVVGPLFFGILKSNELIEIFGHLGVAFLLFLIGLSLDFRVLKEVGKVSIVAGAGQVIITSIVGFIIAINLGFSNTASLFLAAALAFSSTVFVLKLLSDKKESESHHGKISLGILVIQDFIAAIVLLLIPIIAVNTGAFEIGERIVMGLFLILVVFLFTHIIIPGVLALAAKSQDVLLLFTIGWAFLISMLFSIAGFSIEIGALVAGMSLASSKFSLEISSKIKGLREFFVIIHLVFFGSLLVGPITGKLLISTAILSLLILIGNPIIVMSFMKVLGYKKRTNFLTGISIAQISEFSLILIFVGFLLGVVSQEILSLTILIALVTIGISSYSIYYSNHLYRLLKPFLRIFDGRGHGRFPAIHNKDYKIVLLGYNRIGFNILKAFKKANMKYLVVDYNPNTIETLTKKGINCVYGDANDAELLKSLKLNNVKIVISTIPHLETNLTILSEISERKVIFIPTSHLIKDTKRLYEEGADYVIMPHFLGGEFVSHMLLKDKFNKKLLDKEGAKHLKELEERLKEGQDHPRRDFHGK